MPKQLEALMWEQACDAMERAERLYRQFFHRSRGTAAWEAPCDIFESEETLTILIALPGVDLDQIEVTLSAGVLIVSGEAPLRVRSGTPGFTGWRYRMGISSVASSCRPPGSRSPAATWQMAA
jgi:HSP20 family molecular chaperone IbpA